MILFVFLAIGTWTGVLGEDDICDKYLHEVCILPDDFRYASTRAEVDRMCPLLLRNMDCVDDYTRKCRPDDAINKKFHQDFRVLAEEACREDSELHERIVENIGCYQETVQNDLHACHEYLDEKRDTFMKRINSIVAETGRYENDNLYTPYGCLIPNLEIMCLATKSSARCGSDTGDLILELFRRSGLPQRSCALVSEESLAEYLTLLDLEEKITLNHILGKE